MSVKWMTTRMNEKQVILQSLNELIFSIVNPEDKTIAFYTSMVLLSTGTKFHITLQITL